MYFGSVTFLCYPSEGQGRQKSFSPFPLFEKSQVFVTFPPFMNLLYHKVLSFARGEKRKNIPNGYVLFCEFIEIKFFKL